MKKAIIHIGGHKTGSTSIQKSLFDSASILQAQNIYYPLELTHQEISFFGQHGLAWNLLHRKASFGLQQQQVDQSLEMFSCIVEKNTDSELLLSSEDFAWVQNKDAIFRLKEILINFDIYVVIYVRRQDESALALYQTDVIHAGQTQYFNEWLNDRSAVFDYYAIIKCWSKITPNKIIVRQYNRDNFINGDAVSDFESIITEIFAQKITLIKPQRDLNKSISPSITSIIRYYNTLPSKKLLVPRLILLGNKLSSSKNRAYFELISPSTRRAILERFHEGNLELSKKYLELNKVWFDEVITKDDTEWQKSNAFDGAALLSLVNEVLDIITSR